MAIFTHYVASVAADVSVFFENIDLQTTLIASGVAVSLCVTVAWFLVHIVHSLHDGDHHHKNELLNDACKKIVVSSFHMNRKASHVVYKQSMDRFSPRSSKQSIWSHRRVEEKCTVPCISCGIHSADRLCRFLLCCSCCYSNAATVCTVHKTHTAGSYGQIANRSVPKEMDLSHLKLEECPARVGYLGAQLVRLNLANNNLIAIPEEIGCLLGLYHLHLQSNSIQSLPESIRNLASLTELDVGNNELVSLPENMAGLQSLQVLNVSHNHLTTLPCSIGSLAHLQYLYTGSNSITELPDELCNLSNLKVLDVSGNALSRLPARGWGCLLSLDQLDLAHNRLTTLPCSLVQCSALTRLALHHNRLEQLPSHIGRLHQLVELHVQGNRIRYLPASVDALSLDTLTVSPNPLWTEAQSQQANTSTGKSLPVPTLLEIVAARVITLGIPWQDHELPRTLKGMLARSHQCACCGAALFDSYRAHAVYRGVTGMQLPLYQRICPAARPTNCRFIQLL